MKRMWAEWQIPYRSSAQNNFRTQIVMSQSSRTKIIIWQRSVKMRAVRMKNGKGAFQNSIQYWIMQGWMR